MKIHLLTASAAIALLAPVHAYALASEASGFTWTGFFVGANVGYGTGTSDWDFGSGGSNSHDNRGAVFGLQAGYNAQLANGLVAGVVVSTEATNAEGKSGCSGASCRTNIASLNDVSGRLGVNWGSSMAYGKGGVAYQVSEHSITTGGNRVDDRTGSLGYVLGAGFEMAVDNNLTSNIEYNYYSFEDDGASIGGTHIDDSMSISVIKAGLNLKFN